VDQVTSITTICSFNSSSVSTTPPGLTPRYACAHGDVKFIWGDAQKQLTMVERICPTAKGYVVYQSICIWIWSTNISFVCFTALINPKLLAQ
jgi:hypothetical protein